MDYKELYKEVFSQVRPTKEFDPEAIYVRKPSRNITKKLVCAAAVIAVLAGLGITAYAANLFGLRDLLLPQQQEVHLPSESANGENDSPATPEQDTQTHLVDMISLAGYGSTPESRAVAEWRAFSNTYDQDEAIIQQIGNSPTGFEDKYGLYLVYTQEMADKLDEIIAKYGLKLHTSMLLIQSDEQLTELVGGAFLGENRTGGAYMYEDGTFKFDGAIELEGYGYLDYQFLRCVRGSFTDVILNITDVDDYAEWSYETTSGIPVTLALSPHKALIIADLPDSFVTVNVLAGTETSTDDVFSNGPFDAADLERFADSFDFSVLTPARPASQEQLDLAKQQKAEQENSGRFYNITGIEEWQAQEFFTLFAAHIESDDRQAVAEMLCYPATVTHRSTTEAGTHQVYETVESPEEFLPFYDYIFTESLWQDYIMANRYDRERADLIPHNGMIGAAAGAVWFIPTEDGMYIVTVQNGEGCSVRMSGLEITDSPHA